MFIREVQGRPHALGHAAFWAPGQVASQARELERAAKVVLAVADRMPAERAVPVNAVRIARCPQLRSGGLG